MDYKKAGVDIEAGYRSVELMKEHVKKTMRPEVLGGLGGFSGAFSRPMKFPDCNIPEEESPARKIPPGLFRFSMSFLASQEWTSETSSLPELELQLSSPPAASPNQEHEISVPADSPRNTALRLRIEPDKVST